jgi:hypothetical protein
VLDVSAAEISRRPEEATNPVDLHHVITTVRIKWGAFSWS